MKPRVAVLSGIAGFLLGLIVACFILGRFSIVVGGQPTRAYRLNRLTGETFEGHSGSWIYVSEPSRP